MWKCRVAHSSRNHVVLEESEIKDLYQMSSSEFWEMCEPVRKARLTHWYGIRIASNSIWWGRKVGFVARMPQGSEAGCFVGVSAYMAAQSSLKEWSGSISRKYFGEIIFLIVWRLERLWDLANSTRVYGGSRICGKVWGYVCLLWTSRLYTRQMVEDRPMVQSLRRI